MQKCKCQIARTGECKVSLWFLKLFGNKTSEPLLSSVLRLSIFRNGTSLTLEIRKLIVKMINEFLSRSSNFSIAEYSKNCFVVNIITNFLTISFFWFNNQSKYQKVRPTKNKDGHMQLRNINSIAFKKPFSVK